MVNYVVLRQNVEGDLVKSIVYEGKPYEQNASDVKEYVSPLNAYGNPNHNWFSFPGGFLADKSVMDACNIFRVKAGKEVGEND